MSNWSNCVLRRVEERVVSENGYAYLVLYTDGYPVSWTPLFFQLRGPILGWQCNEFAYLKLGAMGGDQILRNGKRWSYNYDMWKSFMNAMRAIGERP